jgi:tRNA uridine 5-carboxymethylaminomethyl modification enzyme
VATFFGVNFGAHAVVLTTGTFMNGRIWVGRASMAAGAWVRVLACACACC